MKDNMVMSWSDCTPSDGPWGYRMGAYGGKNRKYVSLAISGNFWLQASGYGGPWDNCVRSRG
jgi:hypothetical protein